MGQWQQRSKVAYDGTKSHPGGLLVSEETPIQKGREILVENFEKNPYEVSRSSSVGVV